MSSSAIGSFERFPNTLIIGFGHKARHGKDTAVRTLIEAVPRLCRRYAFADALRAVARVQHGMTVKDGNLLQRVGHSMRQENPIVWESALYWAIAEEQPRIALISDVRYRQEAELVKHLGGYLFKVERTTEQGLPFQDPSRDPNHPSETDLDSFDRWDKVIKNISGYEATFKQFTLMAFGDVCLEEGLRAYAA